MTELFITTAARTSNPYTESCGKSDKAILTGPDGGIRIHARIRLEQPVVWFSNTERVSLRGKSSR
jgi:hypothetical protein